MTDIRKKVPITANAEVRHSVPLEERPPLPLGPTKNSAERHLDMLEEQRTALAVRGLALNAQSVLETDFLIRRNILDKLLDPRHDVDLDCGYPEYITPTMYHMMFERDGLSRRVVEIFPKECWAMSPELYDVGDSSDTDFDVGWAKLVKRLAIWSVLHRADTLSGIGRFGLILLGLDDGRDYADSVEGIDSDGLAEEGDHQHKLLFLRVFDESVSRVVTREANLASPRFGKPTMYQITFKDVDAADMSGTGMSTVAEVSKHVHWTRVVHLADNRGMSEVYGTPRMKAVFNRLMDVRKILGGSGEMFWRGAFPGLSFELQPGIGESELDTTTLRDEMERYSRGLQRYIALAGMTAKSLAPQIADPEKHLDKQIEYICAALGVPKRIFLGAEEGKLASNQDSKAWAKRLAHRNNEYVTPHVIRPFVDRLLDLRVLPRPKTEYDVAWPDLSAVSDQEKANTALILAQAISQYVASGGEALIPADAFIEGILGLDPDDLSDMVERAKSHARREATPAESTPSGVTPKVGTGLDIFPNGSTMLGSAVDPRQSSI